jgi:hypothetical protein
MEGVFFILDRLTNAKGLFAGMGVPSKWPVDPLQNFYGNLFPSDPDTTKLNCFNGTLLYKQSRKADTEVCSTQGKGSELLGATAAITVNQISLPFFVFLTF